MEFEITPEPTEAEREALLTALDRLLGGGGGGAPEAEGYRSAWRELGVQENVKPLDEPYLFHSGGRSCLHELHPLPRVRGSGRSRVLPRMHVRRPH